jgi:secondary thiamine-phosphate synthase enzyme
MQIQVKTQDKRQVLDITELVESNISGSGIVNVFVKHTTACITLADLDPGTDLDYLTAIERITPELRWRHPHDPSHFPDHLWSALIGPSVGVPFKNGSLSLGTWQSLVLIELDGPRSRDLELTIITS